MESSVLTSSLTICLLLVLAVAPAQAVEEPEECASPVSVEVACRSASETHHGVAYDHCVASLAADPRSKEAGSLQGLAMLATRMAIDHAASTEAKIDDLADLEPEDARARYNHCLDQYGGAADLLRDALDNLKVRIYGTAMEQLSAALGAAESCEDAWKDDQINVPVAAHDREYGRMAHIALGFTHHAAA
ncbi:putative invertase inhibitor [Oryza brachyantha]|uniref:putative invertase inhibitor n=1 Tax=Oryza brachyantha TaxID=4533 RepID=UPI001ADBEAE7|nr:putative invertase inhibitor [Oryza brachyantha]